MRRELPKYSEYKDSGVEWIGKIPEHWGGLHFKRLCKRVDVGIAEAATHAYCEEGVPIIRSTNVRSNHIDRENLYYIEPWFAEKNRSKYLWAGDLVTVRTGCPGTTAVIPPDLNMCQCFTLVISTPHKTESSEFFSYYLNSVPGMTHFKITGWGSAQINISVPIVQHSPVPWPSPEEQRAIVSFLDVETGKLDRLVGVRRRQIAVLREQRAAVIHHAVTQGLDPTARMKDSGIEWLGEIPAHWTASRIKHFLPFSVGWTPPTGQDRFYGGEHPWCTIGDMKGDLVFDTEKSITDEAIDAARLNLSPKGSLLFSFKLSIGSVAFAGRELFTNEAIATFCPHENVDMRYAYFAFPVFIVENSQTNIYGARLLNQFLIKNAMIALPKRKEQHAIVAHIDSKTAKIDTLIAKYERELELLAEYRSSLISHAVTGKIDVREIANEECRVEQVVDYPQAAEERARYGKDGV